MIIYGYYTAYADAKVRESLDKDIEKIIEANRLEMLKERKEEVDKAELIEAQKKMNKNFLSKFGSSR
jgi:hypothetical protein